MTEFVCKGSMALGTGCGECARCSAEMVEMYQWLRKHHKFANDSMREIWFDSTVNSDDPKELDNAISSAMQNIEEDKS